MHNAPLAARRVIVTAACLAATVAFADCERRKTRPAETAFNARAMAALEAALPPLPAAVERVGGNDFKTPAEVHEVLCAGTAEGDFSVTAKRTYFRKHGEAERRALQAQCDTLTAQFHALKKLPPDNLAEQQALQQQYNAAWQATRDAEKAGDKAGVAQRDAQARGLRQLAEAIETQHLAGVKAQLDALDKRRTGIDMTGQTVEIVLGMNLQRLPGTRADNTRGAYGTAGPGKSVGLKLHNLGLRVDGSDGPLRQALAAAIDRTRLQALVGKPLPSQAESEAFAAQVTQVRVPKIAAGAPDIDSASTATTTAPTTGSARSATTATTATAAPEPNPPAADAEPVKKAAEAVNKLRGLFGR